MKISALIPTYNRRNHIFRAIDSVLAQTVPVDEIIVVDDGSTDGTAEALRSHYGSRVALFTQPNAGVAAARNRGLRGAKGDWIAFLDSDDVWLPTKIERQVEALNTLGDEFGLCFTDAVYEGNPDLNLSAFGERGFHPAIKFGQLDDPTGDVVTGRNLLTTPSILARRLLLDEFDEALLVAEDLDLMFRLAFKTKYCFVAEPLVIIDRTPSREVGLCNLFSARSDQKYVSLERLYTKWLAMPEVAGTRYQRHILETLRETYYNSIEAKIHDFRIAPALAKIGRLHSLGDAYPSILGTLVSRKIGKVRRSLRSSGHREKPQDAAPGPAPA